MKFLIIAIVAGLAVSSPAIALDINQPEEPKQTLNDPIEIKISEQEDENRKQLERERRARQIIESAPPKVTFVGFDADGLY